MFKILNRAKMILVLTFLLHNYAFSQNFPQITVSTKVGTKRCYMRMEWKEFYDKIIPNTTVIQPTDKLLRGKPEKDNILLDFGPNANFNLGVFLFNEKNVLQAFSMSGISRSEEDHKEEIRRIIDEEIKNMGPPAAWTFAMNDFNTADPVLLWKKDGYTTGISFNLTPSQPRTLSCKSTTGNNVSFLFRPIKVENNASIDLIKKAVSFLSGSKYTGFSTLKLISNAPPDVVPKRIMPMYSDFSPSLKKDGSVIFFRRKNHITKQDVNKEGVPILYQIILFKNDKTPVDVLSNTQFISKYPALDASSGNFVFEGMDGLMLVEGKTKKTFKLTDSYRAYKTEPSISPDGKSILMSGYDSPADTITNMGARKGFDIFELKISEHIVPLESLKLLLNDDYSNTMPTYDIEGKGFYFLRSDSENPKSYTLLQYFDKNNIKVITDLERKPDKMTALKDSKILISYPYSSLHSPNASLVQYDVLDTVSKKVSHKSINLNDFKTISYAPYDCHEVSSLDDLSVICFSGKVNASGVESEAVFMYRVKSNSVHEISRSWIDLMRNQNAK